MSTGSEFILPAGKIVAAYAPSVFRRSLKWWRGKKVCVYGQPEAGKTSFIRYLLTGNPADPDEPRTVALKKYGLVILRIKNDEREKPVAIRSIRDRAGQTQGAVHAAEFCSERPHHAIVFLDMSMPYAGTSRNSIEKYATAFIDGMLSNANFTARRLERIWFVLNKRDKASKKIALEKEKKFRAFVRERLKNRLPEEKYRVRVCSLIDDKSMERFRRNLVNDFAASFWSEK